MIDAHHLWDLNVVHYPWLMATDEKRFFGDPTSIQPAPRPLPNALDKYHSWDQ
jgi:hypothetical protein